MFDILVNEMPFEVIHRWNNQCATQLVARSQASDLSKVVLLYWKRLFPSSRCKSWLRSYVSRPYACSSYFWIVLQGCFDGFVGVNVHVE